MMLVGFNRVPPPVRVLPELLAATISGAIYGGVSEWVRSPQLGPVEDVVKSIFALVSPMLGLPNAGPAR